jgi:hypothetical protein
MPLTIWFALAACCFLQDPARTAIDPQPGVRVSTPGHALSASGLGWPGARVHLVGRLPREYPQRRMNDAVEAICDAKGDFTADLLPGRFYYAWADELTGDGQGRASSIASPIFAGCPIAISGGGARPRYTLHVLGLEDWQDRAPFRVAFAGTELVVPESGKALLPPLPAQRFGTRLLDRDGRVLGEGTIAASEDMRREIIAWRKERHLVVDEDADILSFEVEPRATVDLVLRAAQKPVTSGVEIFISHEPQSAWEPLSASYAQGRWRFEAPIDWNEPSQWPEFLIRAPGCADRYLSESDLRDHRDGNTAHAELDLPEGYVLQGRLLLDGKTPLAHTPLLVYASVATESEGGAYFGGGPIRAATGDDGSFAIAGRCPRFGLRLTALVETAATSALTDRAPAHWVWPEIVCHTRGLGLREGHADLGAISLATLHTLDVTVRNEDGSPASMCALTLSERGGSERAELPDDPLEAATDRDGRVRLLVPAGSRLDLVARSALGFGASEVDVPAGEKAATRSEVTIAISSLSIRGRVVDQHGAPIAGAFLYAYDQSNFRSVRTDTEADAAGQFTLLVPHANRKYQLHASCRREGESFENEGDLEVRVGEVSVTGLEVTINMDPEAKRARQRPREEPRYDATVKVRVSSTSTHQPVAAMGVTLTKLGDGGWTSLKESKGHLGEQVQTGADGWCELAVPSGQALELHVDKDDESAGSLEQAVEALGPGEVRELDVSVPTQFDLHFFGQVVTAEGSGVAGARITFFQTSMSEGENEEWIEHETAVFEARADAEGRFDLELPSWRSLSTRAEAEGFTRTLFRATPDHDAATRALRIVLQRAASLEVHVVDGARRPLAGLAVALATDLAETLMKAGGEWVEGGSLKWRETTDELGRCAFQDLAVDTPIAIDLFRGAEHVRMPAQTVTLTAGERKTLELVLAAGVTLRGVLLDQESRPIAGHPMWLLPAGDPRPSVFDAYDAKRAIGTAKTNAQGRFEIADVLPGDYWLGPAALRDHSDPPQLGLPAPVAEVVHVVEGADQDLTIHAHVGLYVRGRVLQADGTPADLVTVLGASESSRGFFQNWCHDGAFAIGPLPPGEIVVWADGREGQASSPQVRVQPGDTDVVLQLQAAGSLEGTVVEAASGKALDAEILVGLEGSEGGFGGGSSRAGRFKIDELVPGTYAVFARTSSGLCGVVRGIVVTSNATASGVRVALETGARISVRYEGSHSAGATWGVEKRYFEAGRFEPGKPLAFLVTPGTITVTLYEWTDENSEPRQEARLVTLAPGAEQEIVFGR